MNSKFYQGDRRDIDETWNQPTTVCCTECYYGSTLLVPYSRYPIGTTRWHSAVISELCQRFFDSDHDCSKYGGG